MTIWIEWIVKHWRSVLAVGLALIVSMIALLSHQDAPAPQPAPPVVQVQTIDTTATQSTSTIKSDSAVKRKVKVKVTLPPETVIGDSTCTIEVVVEDSSGNEVAVEEVRVEDRGLSESVTIDRQEVMPVENKERVFGILGGVGYLPSGVIVPEVGVSLHVYKLVYAQAGLDGIVFGFGGVGLKIGEILGFKILLGGNYTTSKQILISLSLGA
jgi:hypothetical protein